MCPLINGVHVLSIQTYSYKIYERQTTIFRKDAITRVKADHTGYPKLVSGPVPMLKTIYDYIVHLRVTFQSRSQLVPGFKFCAPAVAIIAE